MDQRTREVLEFDKVLELIATRAASSLGREFILGLEPLDDAAAVERRLAPLRELILLVEHDHMPPFGGLFDARELLEHARIEGSALEENDWPRIAGFLHVCGRIVAYREAHRSEAPSLSGMLSPLQAHEELERKLARMLNEEGRLRDDATPELARARRAIRDGEQKLLRTVSIIARDLHERGVLQENFATMRNGRHVFPVRAGSRGRIHGIRHGASASGETVYVEPIEIIEASNEIEVLHEAEMREVHRITLELTGLLRPFAMQGLMNVQVLGEFDGLNALARTSCEKGWHIPIVMPNGALRLFNAEHPLLNLRHGRSVPITMLLDHGDRCLVLSGPNAGGKTTAMKTVGLLALLVQCGSPIPAFPDSSVPVFSEVLADIGDRQDLEEGISTFTGHIQRIRELWRKASPRCLILMDELGTGTDPQEGGALAVALLEGFLQRAGLAITTSHLNPVKVWAEDTEGVRNASFSLNSHTHEPTFQLRLDLPGASEALEIAEREGLAKPLLERARQLAGAKQLEMGELLRRIEDRDRRLAAQLKEATARAAALAEQEEVVRARAEMLRDERRELRESMLRERDKVAGEVRERLERLIADLPGEAELQRRKEALVQAREEVLREQNLVGRERRKLAEEQVEKGEMATGQRVFVRSLGQWGDLLNLDPSSGRARILIGNIEVSAKASELMEADPKERRAEIHARSQDVIDRASGKKHQKKKRPIKEVLRDASEYSGTIRRPGFTVGGRGGSIPERPTSMMIDLHGMRVEEALTELDRFLDRSLLAGFPYVKVCHGTGTGRLYKAVHEFLREHRAVRKYRFGTPDEGGGGVTIVEF